MKAWRIAWITLAVSLIFASKLYAQPSGPPDLYLEAEGYQFGRSYMENLPNEVVDPFSGNLILQYVDINLPGPGGFNLMVNRFYNSNFRYDAFADDYVYIKAPTTIGLGWKLHMGELRIWDAVPPDPPVYEIELPDGSVHSMIANGTSWITKEPVEGEG